jgi:hypothetical protein
MEIENLNRIATESLVILSGKIGRHAADQFLLTALQRARGQISDEEYQRMMHSIFQNAKDSVYLANWILSLHLALVLACIRQTSPSDVMENLYIERFECLKIRSLPGDATLDAQVETLMDTARNCNATLTSLLIDNDQKDSANRTTESSVSSPSAFAPVVVPATTSTPSEEAKYLLETSPKSGRGYKGGRPRIEWTEKEDLLFMEGLASYGKNYERISKMIGSRNRAQVRQHYRYLAKSLRENNKSLTKAKRRIKVRGRPSRTKIAVPTPTMQKLLLLIEKIEHNNVKARTAMIAQSVDCDVVIDINPSNCTNTPTTKLSGASTKSITETVSMTNAVANPTNKGDVATQGSDCVLQQRVDSPSTASTTSTNTYLAALHETLLETSSEGSRSTDLSLNKDDIDIL